MIIVLNPTLYKKKVISSNYKNPQFLLTAPAALSKRVRWRFNRGVKNKQAHKLVKGDALEILSNTL